MMLSSYLFILCRAIFSPFPFGHWSFHSKALVRLQVSDPYVRTGRMHWLYIFLFSDNGRLLFIALCCLPKAFHPIPFFFWFNFHEMSIHQFSVLGKYIPGHILFLRHLSYFHDLVFNYWKLPWFFTYSFSNPLSLSNCKIICNSSVDSLIRTISSAKVKLDWQYWHKSNDDAYLVIFYPLSLSWKIGLWVWSSNAGGWGR